MFSMYNNWEILNGFSINEKGYYDLVRLTGKTASCDTNWYGVFEVQISHYYFRRRFFGLKNLTDPLECLKKFPRVSKYDVGAAEWNPHQENKEICAVSVCFL